MLICRKRLFANDCFNSIWWVQWCIYIMHSWEVYARICLFIFNSSTGANMIHDKNEDIYYLQYDNAFIYFNKCNFGFS